MLPLPATWTHNTGLPQRQGSQGFGIVQSQPTVGQERTQFVSPYPSMGQRDQSPSTSQAGHIGQDQSVGRGRAQGLQAESSGQAGQMMCYHCRPLGHMSEIVLGGRGLIVQRLSMHIRWIYRVCFYSRTC